MTARNDNLTRKEILKFIENQPIRISIFGEFSSGKTTFINSLIGEAILSVAVDPTTAVPTYIRYANEFNVLVLLNNGEKLRLFEDDPPFWTRFVGRQSVLNTLKKQETMIKEFLKEWTKEGERADEVENIVIELPLPWLKNSIELVDTPGTNAGIDSHKQHTKHVSEDTDIAIFIMDARQGGGKKTEFNFINKMQQAVSQSFVVVNKMDLLDEKDDEREDILEYITNEAIPKHWEGVIQPKVFGISSLVRLDEELAKAEPELLKEFKKLISVIEDIATTQRGKILLDRLGNPERSLFEQAANFESEKRFDKAHRVYFDLLDILQAAEMDISPAQKGIERCENILSSQVNELDEINQLINNVLPLEEKQPDETIEQLRKIQKQLITLNNPDEEVNEAIKRLAKRIEIRNKARNDIKVCENTVKENEAKQDFISAVKQISRFHEFIDKAELPGEEHQHLINYENRLIELRNADALNRWKELQEKIRTCFENNRFDNAVDLIPTIKKYSPYLPKNERTDSQQLVTSIKSEYEQWKQYEKLFGRLNNRFIKLFKENAVNSSILIEALVELNVLEKYARKFIKNYKSQTIISVDKDIILPIEKRLQVVDYLMATGRLFFLKKLEMLKEKLLQRKKELAKISSKPKDWFNNTHYFEKYPDHPAFISNLTHKGYKVTCFSSPWKLEKIHKQIENNEKYLPNKNKKALNKQKSKYIRLIKRQKHVYAWVSTIFIILTFIFLVFQQVYLTQRELFTQFEEYCNKNTADEILEYLPKINTLCHGMWYKDKTGQILKNHEILSPISVLLTQQISNGTTANILSNIAGKQAEAGMFGDAVATAKQIDDRSKHSKALAIIARKQAEAGMFDDAIATAKQIDDRSKHSKALATIAEKQVEVGMFNDAITTAKQIYYTSYRSEALADIAEKQADAGDKTGAKTTFETAIATAKQINYNRGRSKALEIIAREQAEVGMFNDAIATAKQIDDSNVRSRALATIARKQADARRFNKKEKGESK